MKRTSNEMFRIFIFARIKKIEKKNSSIILKFYESEKRINNANTHREYKISEFSIQTQNFKSQFINMSL